MGRKRLFSGKAVAFAGQSSHKDAGTAGREMLWGMARQRDIAATEQGGDGPSGGETEGAVCAHGVLQLDRAVLLDQAAQAGDCCCDEADAA